MKNKEQNNSAGMILLRAFLYVLWFFLICMMLWFGIFNMTHRCYIVEGSSMQSYLNPSIARNSKNGREDAVFIDLHGVIKDFDVVVIELSEEKQQMNILDEVEDSIIKRVIASSGEYISIFMQNNNYYIYKIENPDEFTTLDDCKIYESLDTTGYEIEYSYWNQCSYSFDAGTKYENKFYEKFLVSSTNYEVRQFEGVKFVKVPEKSYFCMGDNREYSKDSRFYGFFESTEIVGNVNSVIKKYNFGNRIAVMFKCFWQDLEKHFAR